MSTILGNPITLGGGGAKLNIDFGTTPPSDTSKLWVPLGSKPSTVECSPAMQYGSEFLTEYVGELPEAYATRVCASVGTKVYFFNGTAIDVFDTETRTSSRLSVTLNTNVGAVAGAVAIGSKIYILGGKSGSTYVNAIQVFDVNAQTVTTLSATIKSNGATQDFAIAAVGNVIYTFGGQKSGTEGMKTICKFDTETEQYTVLSATMSIELWSSSAAAVGNKIYVFGGSNGGKRSSYVFEFDAEAETCTSLGNLGTANWNAGIGAVGNKIYLLGGTASSADQIQVFDTTTKEMSTCSATFSSLVSSGASSPSSSAVVGTKIYVHPSSNGGKPLAKPIADIHRFTVETVLAENNLFLQSDLGFDGFWTAVSGKDITLKVKLLNAYLGDSNNIAQLKDAYLYDSNSATWKSLDGVSMTADMLAALATLGVT